MRTCKSFGQVAADTGNGERKTAYQKNAVISFYKHPFFYLCDGNLLIFQGLPLRSFFHGILFWFSNQTQSIF